MPTSVHLTERQKSPSTLSSDSGLNSVTTCNCLEVFEIAPGISTSTRAARALTLLQSILAGQSWGHRASARDALAKAW